MSDEERLRGGGGELEEERLRGGGCGSDERKGIGENLGEVFESEERKLIGENLSGVGEAGNWSSHSLLPGSMCSGSSRLMV